MSMRPGFTLIELMLVLLMGSLLSGLVVTIIRQTMMGAAAINTSLETSWHAAICYERIWQDIAGCCVVLYPQPDKKVVAQEASKDQEQESEKAVPSLHHQDEKVPPLAITTGEGGITQWRCITNNPLRVYNKSQPLLMAVTYQLVPNPENKILYSLQRAQCPWQEKPTTFYTILERVTQIKGTVHYRFIQQEKGAKKPEFGSTPVWPLAPQKGVEIPPLPLQVTLLITFLDAADNVHELLIEVPLLSAYADQSVAPIRQQPKAQEATAQRKETFAGLLEEVHKAHGKSTAGQGKR